MMGNIMMYGTGSPWSGRSWEMDWKGSSWTLDSSKGQCWTEAIRTAPPFCGSGVWYLLELMIVIDIYWSNKYTRTTRSTCHVLQEKEEERIQVERKPRRIPDERGYTGYEVLTIKDAPPEFSDWRWRW